ncbi:MAG: hypothetical protein JWO08_1851 [Verrucomicrobiaceae bacterium]|nr:hypothetical protein [Verrucomicrobiaceae bacterium]
MSLDSSNFAVWQTQTNYDDATAVFAAVEQAISALHVPAGFIRPGDNVVLKPNWVKEHDERFPGPDQWEHVVTHPSVIEGVIRWVAPQLQGQGSITVCDAPQTDSSFATLRKYCGLDEMIARCCADFPGPRIALLDLRPEEWHAMDGVTVSKTELPGDPKGSTHVKLNEDSEFVGFHGLGQLYGASFNMAETNDRHRDTTHEYMLCRTPVEADVLINLPKLKCHKKVGLTCALKNMVGINSNKKWLPHHTEGTPDKGGDQFPAATMKAKLEHSWMGKIKRFLFGRHLLSKLFVPVKKLGRLVFGDTQKVVRSGNWHGNDTCWRMVVDLNKSLFYFDGAGQPRTEPLRYLAVVDGIIGGEGNGPMAPDPKPCGVVVAGMNPLAVDTVCCALMGFDWRKIRMLLGAFSVTRKKVATFEVEDLRVVSNEASKQKPLSEYTKEDGFAFKPHFGWVGAVEK